MRRLIGVGCVAVIAAGTVAATDLTWVNWGGDLKASTASNWSPAQTPQAGDNLTIPYDGSGTKYWHNDLEIEYGHITFAITNTSSTRIDPDQKEVRVTNGITVIGTGSPTLYFRTAVTGTGDFLVDCYGASVHLSVTPTSGRVYSGNFDLRQGGLNAQTDKVLGDETRHGYVYIAVTNAPENATGKLTLSGTWNMYNDIYYDNTKSNFRLSFQNGVVHYGDFYFNGGAGTVQRVGGSADEAVRFYGKWRRWAPPGKALSSSELWLFVTGAGIEFFGGYEDPTGLLSIYRDNGGGAPMVTLASAVDVPNGVKFYSPSNGRPTGTLTFGIDEVATNGLPVKMERDATVNLKGTRQRISDITVGSGPGIVTDSVGGGTFVWSPTSSATFAPAATGSFNFVFDASDVVGTVGSLDMSGRLEATNGTLVVDAGASLPNVNDIVIRNGAAMSVLSGSIGSSPAFHIETGASLEIGNGVVLTVGKAYVDGARMETGDYAYGAGTLRVSDVVYTWTGLGDDGDPANPNNWSGDGHPAADDEVQFNSDVSLTGSLTAGSIAIGAGATVSIAPGVTLSADSYSFGEGAAISSAAGSAVVVKHGGAYAGFPLSGAGVLRVDANDGVVSLSGDVSSVLNVQVASGSLHLATDDVSAQLSLDVAAGATTSVASGLVLPCYTYRVDGVYAAPGMVQVGSGSLNVYTTLSDPESGWHVWTGGAGAADKSIFEGSNWAGGTAPTFASALERISFPDGGDVEIPANARALVNAIKVEGDLEISGDGVLCVGAGGAQLTNAAVTISAPVEFSAAGQEWAAKGKEVDLKFTGILSAHERVGANGSVLFTGDQSGGVTQGVSPKGTRSRVWFAGDSGDSLKCLVVVSNIVCDIRHQNAFSETFGVEIWSTGYYFTGDPHLFMHGLSVKFPVTFYDHQYELVNSTQNSNADITFDYPVKFLRSPEKTSGSSAFITVRDKVVFNSTVYSDFQLSFNNVAANADDKGVWFNGPVTVAGGDDLRNSNGPMRFASDQNSWPQPFRLVGKGSLHSLVDYAFVRESYILFYEAPAFVELNGHDQQMLEFWANWTNADADGGPVAVVNSTGGVATIELTDPTLNKSYFPFEFTGWAGVKLDVASGKTLTFKRARSNTKGPLVVASGTVAFTNSACWHGKSAVTVKGGATLSISETGTFGDAEDGFKTALVVESGATLALGADETVKSFVYAGGACAPGRYGRIGSGAQHELGCISGDGTLTVLSVPNPGAVLIIK